jgi:hypothetical protein
LADVVAKKNFVFSEASQRRGRWNLENIGHTGTFR